MTALWRAFDRIAARLRPWRAVVALGLDALVVLVAWNVTYLFRLGFERWLSARPSYDVWVIGALMALYAVALVAWRVPQAMWRFSGFGEIRRIALACLAAGVVAALAVRLAGLEKVPRAVLALHPWIAALGMIAVRMVYRAAYEHGRAVVNAGGGSARRAIVLGAGEAAARLIAGIHRRGWEVTALLDDDPTKRGARIDGVPVAGTLDALADEVRARAATHVIVALPSAERAQRRRAFERATATGLPVLTMPTLAELRAHGDDDDPARPIDRLRDIAPEDLLGREPVVLDESGVGATLRGKVVFVTGAGGSIGSELCRQIARFAPARLVLFEQSEFNLYTIEQELSERWKTLPLERVIGDVKDAERLQEVMATWPPQVVFHAAAYKHVPLMEEPHNHAMALRNNTLGTHRVAQAAAAAGAERFVLISTDKAVNPTNVMGATKRAAELVVAQMAHEHPATRFMAVRFGNVLGSSGSVIPKFKAQIAAGGPVTVTHPDVTRYFMTIPEAVRLVLQAAAIGESGQVLVLDMGEPVKIVELAKTMIRLAGRREEDVGIVFTGLRPGEKMEEELMREDDRPVDSGVPGISTAMVAGHAASLDDLLGSDVDRGLRFLRRLLDGPIAGRRPT